ncbi:hypothetical protein K450DRAFT_244489 [Umbelopsis ramanniana AG]|uniref:General transcription factor 3C polypeptide 5 n=1 Tax=Umbelopsis ramanniana AG TaxID=1314678 RepID=A0AAD5E8V8_UMBRA|nr:uncharacterized protein K450DRAFT_244489 [Umbelopsis ramanniana AG]KAI8578992.1 hypothetical protein K450DRAFT_244489 [Umbelopsis ramanniana AG]
MTGEPAPKHRIPNTEFVNVEYPGRVQNHDRAFENLGGIQLLEKRMNNKEPEIELKFRPKDPFAHGIPGNVMNTKNLLLKVTRQVNANNPDEQIGDHKAEVVGYITKTCRFRAMADFQYLVAPENRVSQVKKAVMECDVNKMMDFVPAENDYENLELVPPPLFTKQEMPFDYSYQQNPAVVKVKIRQPDGSVAVKLVNRYKQRKETHYIIPWEAKVIPDKPPNNFRPLEGEAMQILSRVQELFQERPIWTRFALRAMLPPSTHKYLSRVLPGIGYNVSSGPWRDTWIRYGYDPNKHPETYQYQLLDQRGYLKAKAPATSRAKRKPLDSNEVGSKEHSHQDDIPAMNHQWDGVIKPEGQNNYMLCDILIPEFRKVIQDPRYRKETCTKESGWIYPTVYKELRKFMKAAYNAAIDGQNLPTMRETGVDFEAALKEDLRAEENANAESSAMDIDENATVAEAASAGPDVSARVSVRTCQRDLIAAH